MSRVQGYVERLHFRTNVLTFWKKINNDDLHPSARCLTPSPVCICSCGCLQLVLIAQRLARWDWRSGGPRFKSHPRLTFLSWSSYQLNQLGSKATSDSTLKQLTTCGYQIIVLFFLDKMLWCDGGILLQSNNVWLTRVYRRFLELHYYQRWGILYPRAIWLITLHQELKKLTFH